MKTKFHLKPGLITAEILSEASREEACLLLALIAKGGDGENLTELCGVSPVRCGSALAFWEGAGVITRMDGEKIIDEFEQRPGHAELEERPAVEVAKSIRDENLKLLFDDFTAMMKLGSLPTADVKLLTELYVQYKLSTDYILSLAAYLNKKNSLSARRLFDKAIQLVEKGCDTAELLDNYIKDLESQDSAEWEYRRVMGIYNSPSPTQRKYFSKWSKEFCYSAAIVGEAYDIAVMNTKDGKGDFRYMDTILTAWHAAGCTTLSECKAQREASRLQRQAASATKENSKSKPQTPRYGLFDVDKAFEDAVERSFRATESKD
jgi:DnaD/phage-associated family protein